MTRPQKTLTDYVVIAISPALIMILIGSLVFFLVEVFYQGEFEGRIRWVFGCCVFASVLISRISIDEGREHSMLFAIPLGLVMLLALSRFVEFRGPLASLSLPINAGLILLILWLADRLTWDCTVIDDRKDASGQGLLQTAGLDHPRTAGGLPETKNAQDLEATTSRDAPAPATWWERFCEYRKRPHAPGVWVIYISLAALPLFGIGQRFIPAAALESRRYAFWMLCYFVASALGLLLNSSFLALRRYLRQRRLEMPVEIAGIWLGTGCAMILILLTVCALLPRPHPEYSITQVDWVAGSPIGLRPSQFGAGGEGAEDPQRKIAPSATGESSRDEATTEAGQNGKGSDSPTQPGQGQASGEGNSSGTDADNGTSGAEAGKPGTSKTEADGSKPSESSQSEASSAESRESNAQNTDTQNTDTQNAQSDGSSASQAENQAAESQRQMEQTADAARRTPGRPLDPQEMLNTAARSLPHAIKWLYYLVFLALVGYLVWRYWDQVRSALQGFLDAIRDFLARLRGGSTQATQAQPAVASGPPLPPPTPFSAFSDPFATGDARRLSPNELVVYTFRALEAWGREHNCTRGEDQTPHEFASRLGMSAEDIGREALRLADLYCAAAYSNRPLAPGQVGRLESLWKSLKK